MSNPSKHAPLYCMSVHPAGNSSHGRAPAWSACTRDTAPTARRSTSHAKPPVEYSHSADACSVSACLSALRGGEAPQQLRIDKTLAAASMRQQPSCIAKHETMRQKHTRTHTPPSHLEPLQGIHTQRIHGRFQLLEPSNTHGPPEPEWNRWMGTWRLHPNLSQPRRLVSVTLAINSTNQATEATHWRVDDPHGNHGWPTANNQCMHCAPHTRVPGISCERRTPDPRRPYQAVWTHTQLANKSCSSAPS